jgi:polyhydroxyalkanoate synthesis regulator phasin
LRVVAVPKKKPPNETESQIERFRAKVRELTDAGQLDPEEADAALDRLVRKAANNPNK